MKKLKYINTFILSSMLVLVLGCASTSTRKSTKDFFDYPVMITNMNMAIFNECESNRGEHETSGVAAD